MASVHPISNEVARWQAMEHAGSSPGVDPLPPARILLVDDHPANVVALEAILEPLGQQLVRAHSGEEALKHLLQHDCAVILMDVQMPGLDGLRTARLIKERERTRHIPIIFLTAISRESEHVFSGYAQGAVDYLVKPFDPEILRSKVSVFVELYQRGEQIKRQSALLREREREMQLRRHEARLRGLLDVLPHPLWTLTPTGEVTYWNHAWFAYTGVNATTLQEVVDQVVDPGDQSMFLEKWLEAQAEFKPFALHCRMRAQDGVARWHLVRGEPERDEHGHGVSWILTATDVDTDKRAEEALRSVNQAKDAFLAAASHELRTPLNVAVGQVRLSLLKLGEGRDPGVEKSLKTIQRQLGRITRLVEDLLDTSRIETGRLALEQEPFDLAQLLSETRERMQVLSEQHRIEVTAPPELALVADRGRVDQVLTNLISNAIRYSPDGGTVQVTAEAQGGEVHVQVSDSGIGIPEDKQRVIFERFGQAHGAHYGGLGLGLTIAHGIVAQHGGRIWVESSGRAGEGSTFHVSFPAHPETAQAASP